MSEEKTCTCGCCCNKHLAVQLFGIISGGRKSFSSEARLWELFDECVERIEKLK